MSQNPDRSLFQFNCRQLDQNDSNPYSKNGFTITVFHQKHDPDHVNRISITEGEKKIELLPSKGLSVGQAFYQNRPVFWEPPFDMVDPDSLDLSGKEVAYKGKLIAGCTYIKTFIGGIELLGLSNWGMNYRDEETGKVHALHGEVSNIPVEKISGSVIEDTLTLSATFPVRTYEGDGDRVWHQRGNVLYHVTRTLVLQKGQPEIFIRDEIVNVSADTLVPDWGYHVTLWPQKGAELHIPSASCESRKKGRPIPENFDIWPPSEDFSVRSETGIIRKGLQVSDNVLKGKKGVRALVSYPDGGAISIITENVPYYQSWICSGGKDNPEFSDKDGNSILIRNWDGIGIEFGSSALDHNGNVDPAFQGNYKLKPGESHANHILIRIHETDEAQKIKHEIEQYNQQHRKPASLKP